jgi:hypothetical protein
MNRFKRRHFLVMGALIALPLLMLCVAPALQVLIQRILIQHIDAPEGRVEVVESEPQMVTEQVETLEPELGVDDLRFSDTDGVEIGRLIDAPLQGEVTIYLEELAAIARFDVTGILSTQVGDLRFAQLGCQRPPFLHPSPVAANALQKGIEDFFLGISRGDVVEIPLASVLKSSGCQKRGEPFNIEPAVAAEPVSARKISD